MIHELHVKWVNDRKQKFTDEQKRVYTIITPQIESMSEIGKTTLTEEELKFVWSTVCQEEHDQNEEKIREHARSHPTEVRALGEYLEGRQE